MNINKVTMLDRKICIHADALDGDGKNWDEKILGEVITADCYGLRDFKTKHPDAKVFIDIGANIGSFPLLVKHLWPDASVVCAEPLTNNYELLELNTQGLSGVRLINKAIIGTDDEEIGFNGPTLVTRTRRNYFSSGDGRVQREVSTRVFSCKIGEMIDGFDSIDFLKIDCEGAEGEIFESIAGTPAIEKIQYINGEWHGRDMDKRLGAALQKTHEYKNTKVIYTDLGLFEAKLIQKQ